METASLHRAASVCMAKGCPHPLSASMVLTWQSSASGTKECFILQHFPPRGHLNTGVGILCLTSTWDVAFLRRLQYYQLRYLNLHSLRELQQLKVLLFPAVSLPCIRACLSLGWCS